METSALYTVLVTMASEILFLSLHFILWQWLKTERKGVYLIAVVALISYSLVMLGGWVCFSFSPLLHLWTSLPVFMFLLIGYLHLYVGIERSVSIRILGELTRAHDNRLTMEDLHKIQGKSLDEVFLDHN